MKVAPQIRAALDATGRPWEVVEGSRHLHIRVEGRLVGILARGHRNHTGSRAERNIVAQIRRAAR